MAISPGEVVQRSAAVGARNKNLFRRSILATSSELIPRRGVYHHVDFATWKAPRFDPYIDSISLPFPPFLAMTQRWSIENFFLLRAAGPAEAPGPDSIEFPETGSG